MEINEILLVYIKKEIIESELDELKEDDELLSTGLVDSMGIMRIVRFIEKTFKISIPFEDMTIENFMTIKAITFYIMNKNK
jgi:acyl carrier protein